MRQETRTRPPLHQAAATRNHDVIRRLVKLGRNPSERDCDGLTPLHWCIVIGDTEGVDILLDAGGDPNVGDDNGAGPLHFSVAGASREIMAGLVSAGARIDARDAEGNTPLHRAANYSHEAIPILLDIGSDPTLRNNEGRLPEECGDKPGLTLGYDTTAKERLRAAREAWELGAIAREADKGAATRRRRI